MGTPTPKWPGKPISLGDSDDEVFVRASTARADAAELAVFVHGLAGSATNWTDLMALLSDELDGAALDLPGFGYSPPPGDGDYSVDAHAWAVARLIESYGRGPVHLFGNSLGGSVATRVAGNRPDLVRTLTLISPALPDLRPRPGPTRILAASVPGLGPWAVGRVDDLSAERRVQGTLDMCFADPTRIHPDRLMEQVEEVRRRDGLDHTEDALVGSARGIVREYLRRSLWRDAAKTTGPTLLVYGRQDRLVDPRVSKRARRTFDRSRVVVLSEVGHAAQMERPEVVAREFRALLKASRAQESPSSKPI